MCTPIHTHTHICRDFMRKRKTSSAFLCYPEFMLPMCLLLFFPFLLPSSTSSCSTEHYALQRQVFAVIKFLFLGTCIFFFGKFCWCCFFVCSSSSLQIFIFQRFFSFCMHGDKIMYPLSPILLFDLSGFWICMENIWFKHTIHIPEYISVWDNFFLYMGKSCYSIYNFIWK